MPIQPVDKIWMDGELVAWQDAKVHVLTHALHYGSGIFEGIRAYETKQGAAVFRLERGHELDRREAVEVARARVALLGRGKIHGREC